jgi:cell division protein FtsW
MSNRFHANYDLIFFIKHFIFIICSLIQLFLFSYLPWAKSKKLCNIIFWSALVLNFVTVALGTKVNGVRRWIRLGGFSLQSSEFVKALVIFPVSNLLTHGKHKYNILLIGICALSCLIQPDLGMTFLIVSSASSLVLLKGEKLKDYCKIIAVAGVGIVLSGIFLTKYAANRLMIFFGQKEGFQISQSLKLFASSKFIGEDENNIYVPDSHCDFMFAEIVSGFGFITGVLVIFIPIIIFFSVLMSQHKTTHDEDRLISIGIANQFAIQSFLHILSNLAFMPTKGLNLPFASFGGSALFAHSIAMGALLGLIRRKFYS